MKNKLVLVGILAGLMACGTLLAHHGTGASYDASKEITVTGVVTQFNWHNPHAQIYFDVKDENGKAPAIMLQAWTYLWAQTRSLLSLRSYWKVQIIAQETWGCTQVLCRWRVRR